MAKYDKYVVRFLIAGVAEDDSYCDTEAEALHIASAWASDAREDLADDDVLVTVTAEVIIANFPIPGRF